MVNSIYSTVNSFFSFAFSLLINSHPSGMDRPSHCHDCWPYSFPTIGESYSWTYRMFQIFISHFNMNSIFTCKHFFSSILIMKFIFHSIWISSFCNSYEKVWMHTRRCTKYRGNQPPIYTFTRRTVTKESPSNVRRKVPDSTSTQPSKAIYSTS